MASVSASSSFNLNILLLNRLKEKLSARMDSEQRRTF